MADFLTRLAQRVLEPSREVRPETLPVFPTSDQFERSQRVSAFEGERAATLVEETCVPLASSLGESKAEASLHSIAPVLEAPAKRSPISLAAAELRESPISLDSNSRTSSRLGERASVPDVAVTQVAIPQVREKHRGHALQRPDVIPIQPRALREEALPVPSQPAVTERASVKITIGRIDVRATAPKAQPLPARSAAARGPQPRSLESYLGERNGRRL